ncbi:hypothetical protein TNCV_2498961 [Trichonephila clavipes]|nr:hypothetical protein TNCV_2498961 [Trichonephila clavipes]
MVLKAKDRRTSCPCHDEFRGPRSDYVRQVMDSWLMSLSREPLKTYRVGGLMHVKSVEAKTSSHWCGDEVMKGDASTGVVT